MGHVERAGWLMDLICDQDSTEAATAAISKWVRVADKCLAHNNFNAIVHITNALLHSDAAKVMWAVRQAPSFLWTTPPLVNVKHF